MFIASLIRAQCLPEFQPRLSQRVDRLGSHRQQEALCFASTREFLIWNNVLTL